MASFTYDPPLPKIAPDAFLQTVRLSDEGVPVGTATWCVPSVESGVVQILALEIAPGFRRRGHAKRLLAAALEQARGLQKSRKKTLRKAWILVRQKQQIVGRSFLTGQSFHHVATVSHLLKDEDGLVYVRAFD